MSCPHCLSTSASTFRRKHWTSFGYRTYFCSDCGRRFNERTGSPFNDLQFPTDIVLLAVLWRLRYKLSFRDVAELLLQRGFEISHETIRAWEFRFAPLVSENLRFKRRGMAGRSWYLDETYIKVRGAGAISTGFCQNRTTSVVQAAIFRRTSAPITTTA